MELCTCDMGCSMNDEGKAVSGAAVSVPGAEVASMCLVSLFITQSHACLARASTNGYTLQIFVLI